MSFPPQFFRTITAAERRCSFGPTSAMESGTPPVAPFCDAFPDRGEKSVGTLIMLLEVLLLSYGEAPFDGDSYRVCCKIDIVYLCLNSPETTSTFRSRSPARM